MSYNHEVCLKQEVLNEYAAEVCAFIYRNEHYGSLVMTDELKALEHEAYALKNKIIPQSRIEPLEEIECRLQEIHDIFKEKAPEPHL